LTLPDDSDPNETGKRLVYFAAERTLMAWIRSALGLMALGFVIDRFGLVLDQIAQISLRLFSRRFSFWAGTALVLLGALMAVVASGRYFSFAVRYHRTGDTDPGRGLFLAVGFTVLVALAGVVIAIFLVTVAE
jgi:putative membrane protein